ncbi:MAG: TetR/AcrR family transcriptional regulator [Eubacteriales bacterium]|nr:TetR/AcrR family transcriptional regulator [Eubacteriales bacterium]
MSKKKEALSKFHQEQILASARMLFAQKGEASVSMDDLAAQSDYSKSTIYVYFISKEDILGHIVLQDMRAIRDGIERCLSENAGLEARYFAICECLANLSKNDPAFLSRVLGSISVDEADFLRLPVLKEIYDTGEQTNRLIERLFSDAVLRGEARETLEPVRAGLVFWSSICSLISFSVNKAAYLQKNFSLSQDSFLRYGFELLLNAVQKEVAL